MNFASINHQTIHYSDSGNRAGPVLLFINSLGTDFRIWDQVTKRFQTSFRIVCYDKRGHGLSSAPPGPYTMADHHQDLVSLMDYLSVKTALICGVSVGGLIAQSIAAENPERVGGLILCDTTARIGTAGVWNERIDAIEQHGLDSIAAGIMEKWFSPDYRQSYPERIHGWRHMLTRTPTQGYIGTCATIRDTDLNQSSKSITQHALVLCGEHDLATPPPVVLTLAELIAHSRFELIPECGHLPCIEQPEKLSGLIRQFIEENHLV